LKKRTNIKPRKNNEDCVDEVTELRTTAFEV
jgi:hypothetical protein